MPTELNFCQFSFPITPWYHISHISCSPTCDLSEVRSENFDHNVSCTRCAHTRKESSGMVKWSLLTSLFLLQLTVLVVRIRDKTRLMASWWALLFWYPTPTKRSDLLELTFPEISVWPPPSPRYWFLLSWHPSHSIPKLAFNFNHGSPRNPWSFEKCIWRTSSSSV